MANFLGFQVTIWSGFSAINKNDNFVDIPANEYHYSGIAIVDYLRNGNFCLTHSSFGNKHILFSNNQITI